MTNKEILEKAIQKAIDGGWTQNLLWLHGNTKDKNAVFMQWLKNLDLDSEHAYYDYEEFICITNLIFNHDFAKALWGNDYADSFGPGYAWKYHLQQMVIADDPIKYLGENV